MSRPLTVREVLDEELRALAGDRAVGPDPFASRHKQQFRALCLSGGGIRSATFCLGVIQGLARKGLLGQFDYLSTVSGGGFIGGWLSSWIARTSFSQVISGLSAQPKDPLDPEPAPIRRLRSFSNYLTPKLGALSADSWTLIATYLRNLFLNWLAILPPLVALLTLPQLLAMVVGWQPLGTMVSTQYVIGLALGAIAIAGSIAAVRYVHVNRPRQQGKTEGTGTFDEKRNQRDFLQQCLFPLIAAATAAMICWAWGTSYASPIGDLFRRAPGWLSLGALGAVIHLAGWLLARESMRRRRVGHKSAWWHLLMPPLTGFAVGVLASQLAHIAPPLWDLTPLQRGIYVWLAVPVLCLVILACSHLYVGYTSTRQSDAEREWSARFTGWMLVAIVAWGVVFGLTLSGPAIIHWIGAMISPLRAERVVQAIAMLGGISGIAAARVARKGQTSRVRSAMALGLATIFVVWLVIVMSWVGSRSIAMTQRAFEYNEVGSTEALIVALFVVAALMVFGLVSGRLIDTNMFSLHAMYRARLIRAYLGASRPEGDRDPNPFTGFDDDDNLHLRDLWPQPAPPGGNQRPFHVINATLNLVAGENLAWQERKAESFTFSPLHCGSNNVGYRPTQDDPADPSSTGYAGTLGASLGTALAISGAAASPSMGYHSSPVLGLLLAFFNVRLGWWLGNPGDAGADVFHRSSPKSSLGPIIDEALGRTTDRSPYVFLSDGGHFENLGLYEMVLRRCHTIVVVDATIDAGGGSVDLGNAIRKIRVDLGVPVDMTGHASPCGVGTIRYSCVDPGAPDGVLIHIRPALSASDPADVRAYAEMNPGFPHESTVDQWFTESQFESYRQLGSHIIETVIAVDPPARGATMEWFAAQASNGVEA